MFLNQRINRAMLGIVAILATGSLLVSAAFGDEKPSTTERGEPVGGMMTCPMMAGPNDVKMYADGPSALLARADELRLGKEQIKRLEEIQQEARQQARNLLTAKQRERLGVVPEERVSMMQSARVRMKQMREASQRKSKEEKCPCCKAMTSGEEDEDEQEDSSRDVQKPNREADKEERCCSCCRDKMSKHGTGKQTNEDTRDNHGEDTDKEQAGDGR